MPLVVRQEGKRNYNENEMFGGGALEEVFAMGAPLWLASGRQARAGVRFFIAAVPVTRQYSLASLPYWHSSLTRAAGIMRLTTPTGALTSLPSWLVLHAPPA